MQQYDNTNRGVLFRNRKKQRGDNRPDYTGRINVSGVDAFISGWVKEACSGDRFLSIAVQTEDLKKGGGQRGNRQRPAPVNQNPPAKPAQEPPADDDIPF